MLSFVIVEIIYIIVLASRLQFGVKEPCALQDHGAPDRRGVNWRRGVARIRSHGRALRLGTRSRTNACIGPSRLVSADRPLGGLLQPLRVPVRRWDAESLRDNARSLWTPSNQGIFFIYKKIIYRYRSFLMTEGRPWLCLIMIMVILCKIIVNFFILVVFFTLF